MALAESLCPELRLLTADPKNGTSHRLRDRARRKLKALGFIRFDRKPWTWVVLLKGYEALIEAESTQPGSHKGRGR